ncbi:competence protein CoiA [Neobacillus drentensis]|uniref:competence protein CoiA family protein n=1 Tax=Neobacillus drentensis TaxID=220684 RepID=UPI001F2F5CD6|nr:competence protein CoiA family protein [Neobacillus drentensis]ULT57869.1 competence protein CoiA [Neobacillus drentensis]
MKEALHVIDNDVITLPNSTTTDEVSNLKKLAEKNLFHCPYCKAKLIVKYGDEKGLYFSHMHSEACEESRKIDKAEKKYKKQIERETKVHQVIQAILHDELTTQAKNNPQLEVNYGYKAKPSLKEYPDIWVRIGNREFAISVVTNVTSTADSNLSNQISKRHQTFLEHGMEPIWFIEKKEQSIEKDKNSIVLWDAELTIAAKTTEDQEWDSILSDVVKDEMFFTYFNYPVSHGHLSIDVRSMYYIYSNGDRIVVKVQRLLKDRIEKPYRAFLLNEGYEIPFADALVIKNGFVLSKPEIDQHEREDFLKRYQHLRDEYHEKLRVKEAEQQKVLQEANEQEERLKAAREEEQNCKHQLRQEMIKQRGTSNIPRKMNYEELKSLLRVNINLIQREQMELWSTMPGLRHNYQFVWDLVVENKCKSFDELRPILQTALSKRR